MELTEKLIVDTPELRCEVPSAPAQKNEGVAVVGRSAGSGLTIMVISVLETGKRGLLQGVFVKAKHLIESLF